MTTPVPAVSRAPGKDAPWQLRLFRKSLKKQQKLSALLKVIGPLTGKDQCLLVTCGDNNGALNWHFREHGGSWTWADAEETSIAQIEELAGGPVLEVDKDHPVLDVADGAFDLVVTIDVHEHLQSTDQINRELARVVRSSGRVVVTTPGGDPRKLANRIKHWAGMSTRDYGHVVDGYSADDLASQLAAVNLTPVSRSSYSRFFTEMVELAINLAYVKVLSRRSKAKVEEGQIAPQTKDQVKSVEKSIKIYSLVYPFVWLVSKLDFLVGFTEGHAVIVAARKDPQ